MMRLRITKLSIILRLISISSWRKCAVISLSLSLSINTLSLYFIQKMLNQEICKQQKYSLAIPILKLNCWGLRQNKESFQIIAND
jgi:hypothetical protein